MTGSRLVILPGLTRAVISLCGAGTAATVGITPVTGSVGSADGGAEEGAAVLDGEGECNGAGAGLTVTDAAAVGSVVIGGLVVAPAVAVIVAAVPAAMPAGVVTCACIWNDDGETSVASDPIVHDAAPSPLGHEALNAGCAVAGAAVSVTDTPDADPFWVQTVTVKAAGLPGVAVDWDTFTLAAQGQARADAERAVQDYAWAVHLGQVASADGKPR